MLPALRIGGSDVSKMDVPARCHGPPTSAAPPARSRKPPVAYISWVALALMRSSVASTHRRLGVPRARRRDAGGSAACTPRTRASIRTRSPPWRWRRRCSSGATPAADEGEGMPGFRTARNAARDMDILVRGPVTAQDITDAQEILRRALHAERPIDHVQVKLADYRIRGSARGCVAQVNVDCAGRVVRGQQSAGTVAEAAQQVAEELPSRLHRLEQHV